MMATIKIHETDVKKLAVGMPAGITVDALPGKVFSGHINQIAPLPDPTSFWINPDLKVYNTEVYVDGEPENLRSGMTCEVEIIAKVFTNTVYIPIQSVVRINGTNTVYILNGGHPQKRAVITGDDNGRMIRVISGLRENELVLLTPPLPASGQENTGDRSKQMLQHKVGQKQHQQKRINPSQTTPPNAN